MYPSICMYLVGYLGLWLGFLCAMSETHCEIRPKGCCAAMSSSEEAGPEEAGARPALQRGPSHGAARTVWFSDLFGFEEAPGSFDKNRSHFCMDPSGTLLECETAPESSRRQHVGGFELPSLAELRTRLASSAPSAAGGLRFSHVPGDVGQMILDEANAGAVFQVASQFNCLEMAGPHLTPADGVTIYINDRTQGPACALACPAATIYRNYFHGGSGQHPPERQIDTLCDVGALLGNEDNEYWTMRNGYCLPTHSTSLSELAAALGQDAVLAAEAEGALRVGVHHDTQVREGKRGLEPGSGSVWEPNARFTYTCLAQPTPPPRCDLPAHTALLRSSRPRCRSRTATSALRIGSRSRAWCCAHRTRRRSRWRRVDRSSTPPGSASPSISPRSAEARLATRLSPPTPTPTPR